MWVGGGGGVCMVQRGEHCGLLVFFFGGFIGGVDGGFVGFCRLDVVVVCVWCSGDGDCEVGAMVDWRLLWFWGFFLVIAGVGGGGGCLGGFR